MKKIYLLPAFFVLIFYSCKDTGTEPPIDIVAGKGIYIICEGGFAQNNATITYYNEDDQELVNDAYGKANNNNPLGDIANSMFIFDSLGYIAVNGSNKIEVIDLKSFKSRGFVDLGRGSSPREVWIKDSLTGYTTSFSGNVIKFNPSSGSILKNIPVDEHPEGLAEKNGKLFVANSWFGDTNKISNTVSVINIGSDVETARIRVGLNPIKVLAGKDGKIYVITSGKYMDPSVFSGIYIIDPIADRVIDSIKIESNPIEACFTKDNKMLVINSEGVYEVNYVNKTIGAAPLIPTSKVTAYMYGQVYSVAYNSQTEEILCGNPKDYQQNGEVVFFDLSGNEKRRIVTGINPGTIVLK